MKIKDIILGCLQRRAHKKDRIRYLIDPAEIKKMPPAKRVVLFGSRCVTLTKSEKSA